MGELILDGGELKISSHLSASTIFFISSLARSLRPRPSLKCVTAPNRSSSSFKRPQMSNEREILDPMEIRRPLNAEKAG